MTYPRPLSGKSINKLFESWKTETVEVLHRYYEAFALLYGSIQLADAWKIFKQFEPKIHKKQFIEFSTIVRRENVPYYIFEIDEIYCDERRFETERYIVNREIILSGYGKYRWLYMIDEEQCGKPYYAGNDLLEVAKHRWYDQKIRQFINNMMFTQGENAGKRFNEAYFLTELEKFNLEYYKSETKRAEIRKQAEIPFSEKLMKRIIYYTEFTKSSVSNIIDYLKENDYVFESDEKVNEFIELLQEFNNKSHLWKNCGNTPEELFALHASQMPQSISFGPGIQKAFADGTIDREELIRKIKKMGIEVID